MKLSTTAIGDILRDRVIKILESEGHEVSREIRIDTKKIDILWRIDDEFNQQCIAIECKNENRNLSQKDVNNIFADHSHLIDAGNITDLFIISKLDFSPEAKGYARRKNGLTLYTIKEFEEKKLGYRRYCRQVESMFHEDGLSSYYIQPKIQDSINLHGKIEQWLDSDDNAPVAILGGYGMGKTSYCKYLTNILASKYLEGNSSRIPIYIKLSDIATQVEIDGLISKTLTSRYNTTNYSFEKFKRLNKAGMYVLIFDGFDEMKHALSWGEFKFNFSQIHTLLERKAKILIAGRPNAFLSDSEHSYALRGEIDRGEQIVKIPGAPEYIEFDLQQFSESDASVFLRKYLEHFYRGDGGEISQTSKNIIDDRVLEFEKVVARSELYRPVHLQIYADIATDPNLVLTEFTTYELYEKASLRISERENEKHVRKNIDPDLRQKAIEDIAWWLWDTSAGRSLSFDPMKVPESVVGLDLLDNKNYDKFEIYREIFTGSFVERKHGEKYYFAHRSFLEFFVARRISQYYGRTVNLNSVCRLVNSEVLSFLSQSRNYTGILKTIFSDMQRHSGEMPRILLSELVEHQESIRGGFVQTPIAVLLKYFPFTDADDVDVKRLFKMFMKDIDSSNQDHREAAVYYFFRSLLNLSKKDLEQGDLLTKALNKAARSIDWNQFAANTTAYDGLSKFGYSRSKVFDFVFLRASRLMSERSQDGEQVILFNISNAFSWVEEMRPPKITIGENGWKDLNNTEVRIVFSEVFEGVSARSKGIAEEILRVGVSSGVG